MKKDSDYLYIFQSVLQDDINDSSLLMPLMMQTSLMPDAVEEYPSC
jgi:hypothetical protein